jgi:hypothetical protein
MGTWFAFDAEAAGAATGDGAGDVAGVPQAIAPDMPIAIASLRINARLLDLVIHPPGRAWRLLVSF